jgi:peptidoglycan/xylan/chitin deacetylase (PgdA/CDA1 family)
VSLTFDDGIATQNQVRPVLASHGMHGTFYINSGNIEQPFNPYFMVWSDVDALAANGNEIGGHTVDHERLPDLTPSEQRDEVCDDAAALRARGYTITDFAYPFGAGEDQPAVIQALDDCGYLSARTFGELRSTGCSDCDYAETIPPFDKYSVRTPEWHAGPYTLAEMKGWITQAEQHGGGWVPLVFHDICNGCADVSVSLSDFTALLDWLQPRAATGTIVKTVREVIGNPPSFVRPKSAAPVRASLVPAYRACTSGNRTHGPPLAYASCNPPARTSSQLTVGTPDANGQAANSVGSLRLDAVPGNPSTSADEADVNLLASISDVRRLSNLGDYTGELQALVTLRVTDKLSGDAQSNQAATVQDLPFSFTIPCSATASTSVGSTCSTATTADAVNPGTVIEGARSSWQVGQVNVMDGGSDGVASTAGNTLFMVQGLFVP